MLRHKNNLTFFSSEKVNFCLWYLYFMLFLCVCLFCFFMMWKQVLDDCIFAFFAVEMVIKMVALGIFGANCYLGDKWNQLDFVIVMAGLVSDAPLAHTLKFLHVLSLKKL